MNVGLGKSAYFHAPIHIHMPSESRHYFSRDIAHGTWYSHVKPLCTLHLVSGLLIFAFEFGVET